MALFLGLDIGTTSTIGILIDDGDRVLAKAARPADLRARHPGWAEEDPRQWWRNVCEIVPRLLDEAGCAADEIAAVGVTGMVPAVVLLDRAGRLLRDSIQQSDGRAGDEVAELAARVDPDAFLRRTGNGVNQQLVAAKLLWIERHEPEVFAEIATVFGSYDYIAWKLTGAPALDHNWALEAGFVDLAAHAVAPDLVALGHIAPEALPPMRRSHEIVGAVGGEAARATGLAPGTPVIAGCADHVASAYVAGVIDEGDILIKFGGAGDILAATREIRPDSRLFTDFHLVPGLFMPNGCMASTGSLLNWFAAEFAIGLADEAKRAGRSLHQHLDRLASAVPPGAGGVAALPYFLGEKTPIHDPRARGTFTGLSLNHGPGHLWRALLEATVFGFRHHFDVLREIGYPVTRVLASDGGTASDLWMQIAADILGMPIQLLDDHPGSCLGAAWLAGLGCGAVDDWAGVTRFVGKGRTVEPEAGVGARYDAGYALYRDLYEALKPLFPRMT